MNYYLEITLVPDIEVPINFLWEKVYSQVHMALVENQGHGGISRVGVSFPDYDAEKHRLGDRLRLFSESKKELEDLDIGRWLSNLTDYTRKTGIRDVPQKTMGYVCFRRVQPKSSNARLARRKAKRAGISFEQAMQELSAYSEQTSTLPFIHVKSGSSQQRYRLLIDRVAVEKAGSTDSFSTYGLSSTGCVPMF